jgi:8-oxo-dGTP pyrophosphatase MutT (NUDIX family)
MCGAVSDIRRLGGREVHASPWVRVRVDDIEYADGTRSEYTVVERKDFVTVVPSERDGFWIVEQFRYPLGRREWEFPQGAWPHDRDGTVEELAVAELAEETGLAAERLEHLGRLNTAPGLMTQRFDVFLATGLTQGDPRREASEADMVHRWVPEAQLREMIRAGTFADAHSLAALALLSLRRGDGHP